MVHVLPFTHCRIQTINTRSSAQASPPENHHTRQGRDNPIACKMLFQQSFVLNLFGIASLISLSSTVPTKANETSLTRRRDSTSHSPSPLDSIEPPVWRQRLQPTHCEISWSKISTPSISETTFSTCEDSSRESFVCDFQKCHMGDADQSPEEKPLREHLYFTDCQRFDGGTVRSEPLKKYTVYPQNYEVYLMLKTLITQGFAKEDEGRTLYTYLCTWKDDIQKNSERVWCDNCTLGVWM